MNKRVLGVAAGDPQVLLPFLRARLGLDEDEAQALLRHRSVYLRGQRVKGEDRDAPLELGAQVVVYIPPARDQAPRVVHEDADVLVLDKPAGLPSEPGPSGGHSVESWLAARGPRGAPPESPHLLHRLDREASGLLLVARSALGRQRLHQDLVAGRVKREYVAVVAGVPPEEGRIDLRIARTGDPQRRQALPAAAPGGQPALTRYRREEVLPGDRARVRLWLDTGRTHQIRVHMQALGHPIVGDSLYGGPSAPRLCLHAARLSFPHPATGAIVEVESPSDF